MEGSYFGLSYLMRKSAGGRDGYLDNVCFASSIRRAQDSGDSNRNFNVKYSPLYRYIASNVLNTNHLGGRK